MEAVGRSERYTENWFSGLRDVLEKSFIKVNHEVNAVVIMQAIESLDFDNKEFISTIKNLSAEEWSLGYVVDTLKRLDTLMGISDEFLKKHAVEDLQAHDLKEVKWEIMKRLVTDYARFTKEFYDSLKYSRNKGLSRERYLLMIEIMGALQKIHASAKILVDKYSQKKYNATSFRKFMDVRIAIEHLLLRVFYILLNIDNDKMLLSYRDVLSREVIEYTVNPVR